jgi:uncharacterized integral membrane protein
VKIIYRAALFLLVIFLILFAISNRGTVTVGFWPLSYLAEAPLYLLVFLSALIGALGGAAAAWIAGRRDRRELRSRRRRIEALERELSATQSHLAAYPDTSRTLLPGQRGSS